MKIIKMILKMKVLLIIFLLPSISYAGNCIMGTTPNVTTGALELAIDPRVNVGDILGYRYSKGLTGQMLVVTCTGSSPYRAVPLLTASTTVEGAYETDIAGVGVFISDIYKPAMTLPYTTSLSPNVLTPWLNQNEVRLTFVKTGPITPGTAGSKTIASFYLNSQVFASIKMNSMKVTQKSCLADVNSQNKIVDLGSPVRSEFSGIGSVAASSERNFSVLLQCQADNIPVQVTFDPVGDVSGDGLLAISSETNSATGVAVEVLDASRTPLSFATAKTYHNASERTIEIPLVARYKQTGTIGTGTANAAMTFTITQN
ncbi:fimbrial protein [Kalamiella sp. sgz302252]|uniref:fimbrial protein n=1 Tax=Pantoea sp. sgz302252 TaxID=3341827 RepID=UPI0036D2A0C8